MKKKYKLKKKRKIISPFNVVIIGVILIALLSTAYSLWSTNLTIEGNVNAKRVQTGTVNAGEMQITLDEKGIITLNGKISGNYGYFVKISNGLSVKSQQYETTDTMFPAWMSTDSTIIAETGDKVKHSVEYISGTWSKDKELNVVIRDATNMAVLNCKLSSGIYETTETMSSNARVEYLYLKSGLSCDNLKLKSTIQKFSSTIVDTSLNMKEGEIIYNGMTCTINLDGTVTLNGTAKSKTFIKLSDGLATTNSIKSDWSKQGKIIASTGDSIIFKTTVISGTASGTQINSCLRNIDNKAHSTLKLISGQTSENLVLTNDISVIYIYMDKGAQCNNYIIRPSIQIKTEGYN